MSEIQVVPSAGTVRVTASQLVQHLCPHVDEVDVGAIEIEWTAAGSTVELHSLAAHLTSYRDARVSHEDLVASIAEALDLPGIADVTVTARFTTGGLDVEVSSAVSGDAIVRAGT